MIYTHYTTLAKIRAQHPCKDGFAELLKSYEVSEPNNTPMSYMHVYETIGITGALWVIDVTGSNNLRNNLMSSMLISISLHSEISLDDLILTTYSNLTKVTLQTVYETINTHKNHELKNEIIKNILLRISV